jgi:hypothetical protein
MAQSDSDRLREQLIEVVQATSNDVRHAWYTLRPSRHPDRLEDETAEEIVTVALRRWRSQDRRKGGRRDPTTDLAKGLHEHYAHIDWPSARRNFQFLAEQLAQVLRQSRSEAD